MDNADVGQVRRAAELTVRCDYGACAPECSGGGDAVTRGQGALAKSRHAVSVIGNDHHLTAQRWVALQQAEQVTLVHYVNVRIDLNTQADIVFEENGNNVRQFFILSNLESIFVHLVMLYDVFGIRD